jgi:cysteinyl-tRNA synthetase
MVNLSRRLAGKGFAYEKLRSLYFDISRFADYGKLSGIDINKIRLGATVDLDEYEKENPRDFTLFKRATLSELKRGIFTKTEWGNVRPSWHIQCAAISMKYLGEHYDVYAGSRELLFPHHENVNAIARAVTGKPLARFWIHCDRILIDGKKVDENDSGLTLDDLINMGFSGRLIRYWLFSTHYRKPITFARDRLNIARLSLARIDHCIYELNHIQDGRPYPELDQLLYDIKHGFRRAMDEDLNVATAMASLFSNIKTINVLLQSHKIDAAGAARILDVFRGLDAALGFLQFDAGEVGPEIRQILKDRERARLRHDWALADKLRDQLRTLGVVVRDRKLAN